MVEIFVDQISERLIYTLDFVFNERNLTYKLNNDFLSFESSTNQNQVLVAKGMGTFNAYPKEKAGY